MSIKLKVCGMREPDNINALSALMPDYMGFIFYDRSKRYIGNMDPELTESLPASIKATGVFVNEDIENVLSAIRKYQLKAVQLHGTESPAYCSNIRTERPEIELIKAFGVNESFNFEQLNNYVNKVDYFLFDTQTPEHGGSGITFNWQVLENYQLNIPYFLSGGIGLEQLSEIHGIVDTRLYAIDVNSRFELAAALKDIDQLTRFKNELLSNAQ